MLSFVAACIGKTVLKSQPEPPRGKSFVFLNMQLITLQDV